MYKHKQLALHFYFVSSGFNIFYNYFLMQEVQPKLNTVNAFINTVSTRITSCKCRYIITLSFIEVVEPSQLTRAKHTILVRKYRNINYSKRLSQNIFEWKDIVSFQDLEDSLSDVCRK